MLFFTVSMSLQQDLDDALLYLPPNFLDFKFSSCKDAKDRINAFTRFSPPCRYVVIREIPIEAFIELDENREISSRNEYFVHINLAVLYLKMPNLPHNKAFTRFRRLFDEKALSMGIRLRDYSWYSNLIHTGMRRNKEPDECFYPVDNVQDQDWPTLVIEVGTSETMQRLRQDAIWWLRQGSQLQYVVLVGLDTENRRAVIEKWELVDQPLLSRPITRSLSQQNPQPQIPQLVPRATEIATIEENGVVDGSLHFSFARLFNRQPNSSEHIFVFGADLSRLVF